MTWNKFKTFTSLRQTCPVCGGEHKSCKIFDSTYKNKPVQKILCRTQAPSLNYSSLGLDRNGLFEIFIETATKDSIDEEVKNEWKDERQRQRDAERKAKEKERQDKLHLGVQGQKTISPEQQNLGIQELDFNFRELLKQLTLSQKHKEALLARGLTEQEIKLGFYRSVKRYQPLKGINPKLPGVNQKGDRWVNSGGLLVPVFQGIKIIGCQIRLDYETEGGKYRWLKSESSSHLSNGEIPLAIIKPPQIKSPTIGLTESTGFKPFIAARKLNQTIIGAAGGNFASSPRQLRKAIIKHPRSEPLTLYPDAGSLLNPNVFRQYQKLHYLLKDWGFNLQVADWGQFFNKKIGDIDEWIFKHSPEDINYIDWDAFAFQWKQSKAEYHRLRKYKATEKINQRYLSAILPQGSERELIAIKSAMDTGKTEIIRIIIETFSNKHGGIILGSRNGLLLQTGERLGCYHLHQDDAFILTKDKYSWIANCVDSLHRWDDEDFNDRILILDEWSSTIKHLLIGNTIRMRRSAIVAKFEEAVKRARYIFLSDGNLKDSDVAYIAKLSGIEKIRKIFNEYQPNPREINFCLGSIDEYGEERPNDASSFTEWIFKTTKPIGILSDSQKECEAIHRKLLDKGRNDSEIIRIDSKTITEDYAKDFLKNPAKYIKDNCIKYVILSPSAESGVDINMSKVLPGSITPNKKDFRQLELPFADLLESPEKAQSASIPDINLSNYFSELYFIRYHIDTETALQMLNRFRDPNIKWNIWSKPYLNNEGEGFSSPFERRVYEEIKSFIDKDLSLLSDKEAIEKLKAIIKDKTDVTHLEAIAKINALRNYDRANLRANLLEALEHQGHSIKQGWIPKEQSNLKEYKQIILKETALIIYESEDIDLKTAEEINNSWIANWKDKCKAEKSLLINKILPTIADSPIWGPELIEKIKGDRYMLRRLGLRYFYFNPDMAQKIQEEKWGRLLEAENPSFFPSDWRSGYLIVKTLEDVGVGAIFKRPSLRWDGNEPALKRICELAGHWRRRYLFGKQGGLSTIQFLNRRVLSHLGYKLARKRRRIDGEVFTYYVLQDLYETLKIGEDSFALASELEKAIAARYQEPEADPATPEIDTNVETAGSPSNNDMSKDIGQMAPDPIVGPGGDCVQNHPQREIKVGDRVVFAYGGEVCLVSEIGDRGYLKLKSPAGYYHSSVSAVKLVS